MAKAQLPKEEELRRLCSAMLRAIDDHRLTSQQRAAAERDLRNLRGILKRKMVDPGSSPG